MDTLNALKLEMQSLLREDPLDNDRLLNTAHKIAELEKGKVRFSVDAGVIDRLGQELVARQETALSELVKNAYDADAKKTSLTFIDSDTVGGTLVIEDDGDGMTRDELVDGFMRISSTSKVHEPVSRTYKRKRAGEKGIGRFAVQRLGAHLTIITQTEQSEKCLKLDINWDAYEKDMNLMSISNTLTEIEKTRLKGTTLIISNLRDKWSEPAIKRVYRYVINIIQPYPLSKLGQEDGAEGINTDQNTSIDPGFKTEFYKHTNGNESVIADDSIMIFEHAAAVIEGYIDQNGKGIYSISSDKFSIDDVGEIGNDPDDKDVPFSHLKDIKFKAYYFLYSPANIIPKTHESSIKKLARKEGGIRMYRNGFRVLPYGEPGNDWLKLDESVGKRVLLSPHGNNNFFGFVEMHDLKHAYNETSSREGLIENEALIQLKNFVYRTLLTGVFKVASVRKSKILTSQKKDETGDWEEIWDLRIKNIALTLDELEREFENGAEGPVEAKRKRKHKINKLKKEIKEIENIQEKLLKERSMLRVLSSVGLTVSLFIHEIKYYIDNIKSDIRHLSEVVLEDDAAHRLNILNNNFSIFQTYTSYFNDVVSQNVVREIKPINLKYVVQKFIDSISPDAEKVGIIFEPPKFNKIRLITKPMHPSEWSSILFNFYTNSRKAIKRENVKLGKILIECGETEDGQLYLEFSDNGDGITKENEEFIFDEFFTTTSPSNLDDLDNTTEIIGTGLGLKIVKDIVKSYRGDILVVSAKGEYSTCIRIVMQKASEKDLEIYAA